MESVKFWVGGMIYTLRVIFVLKSKYRLRAEIMIFARGLYLLAFKQGLPVASNCQLLASSVQNIVFASAFCFGHLFR